jgi:gluconate 2-dehydrogenase gamma chain
MPESGLDPAQLALLDAITSRLIPSGNDGLGAHEARVSRYIDLALADDYRGLLPLYIEGLADLDAVAVARRERGFLELTPEEQDGLLAAMEAGEAGLPLQTFFEIVLRHTREGMFGDPVWGGNDGYAGWRLLGYAGPRYEWTAEEQQLDFVIEPRYGDRGER